MTFGSRDFAKPGRSAVFSRGAMAATSHPLATQTALSILQQGGNAVDAAIAAVATLCVVEPHMTGIGGDCFALVGTPDGRVHGLNASGRSAANLDMQYYLDLGEKRIPETSAHSVTVPGAIAGWAALAERFGSLSFKQLFGDAIHYGEQGYVIHPRVAKDWKGLEEKLNLNEGARKHYLVDGKAPGLGDVHYQPALAATFRKIAEKGKEAFYQGEIAEEIAQTVQAGGGFLQVEDLANMQAEWVEPISASFNGHDVFEIPPNGHGITALLMLRMMEKIGLPDDPDSLERYHLMVECARLAYGVRNDQIADPESMTTTVEAILAQAHIDALASLIKPERAMEQIRLPELARSDTVYLSVVDENGLAVSLINSTFAGFGSGIVTMKGGIALQNRGCGFVLTQGHPNCIAPAKRPLHTIIPGMVKTGNKVSMSFGVMGGQYQPMGHAHVLSNILHYNMDPQQALNHPRLFWNEAGELVGESSMTPEFFSQLAGLGHPIAKNPASGLHGGGQVILIDHDGKVLVGGSDPRKDGCALGFR